MKNINGTDYTTFSDLWNDNNLISDDSRARIDFEVALISKLIEAREQNGVTQKKLAEMSGLTQSAIARLENMKAVPQLNTLIKLLRPLGLKLAIVPNEQLQKTA